MPTFERRTVNAIEAELLERYHSYEASEDGWKHSYPYKLRQDVFTWDLLGGFYPVFSTYAEAVRQNGWSFIPQEQDDRRPAKIYGRTLEWRKWQTEKLPREELDFWLEDKQARRSNLALILGAVSGNSFAIDIDVTDRVLARKIEMIALETLGMTHRRVGNQPKAVLLYRAPDAASVPRKMAYHLSDADGGKSGHAIEILGQSSLVTALGYHHSTGRMFEWTLNQSPATSTPEDLIVVSPERVQAFLDRVEEEVSPFWRNAKSISAAMWNVGFEEQHGDVRMPKVHVEFPRDASGRISRNREQYLFLMCKAVVRRNACMTKTKEDRAVLVGRVVERFVETADMSGKWYLNYLQVEATEKVERLSADLAAGRLSPMNRDWTPSNIVADAPETSLPAGFYNTKSMTRWLPRQWPKATTIMADPGFDPASRAIALTPDAEAARVSAEADKALDRLLRDILWSDDRETAPAHLLTMPTGAGKTSRSLRTLRRLKAEWRRDHPDHVDEDGTEVRPRMGVVFALPSHANTGEAFTRLQEENLVREAAEDGLTAMVFRGKAQPGMCQKPEHLKALMDAGIGTRNLCSAIVKKPSAPDGEEEVECPFRGECEYWAQVRRLRDDQDRVDILFMPHAYLGLGSSLPKPITEFARCLIVDESVVGVVFHSSELPVDAFDKPRRPPTLTKAEREAGIQADDHLEARSRACAIAKAAVLAGRDPASDLLKESDGMDMLASALTVCSRSDRIEAGVSPLTSLEAIQAVCTRVLVSSIRQEATFWRLVRDRAERLVQDRDAELRRKIRVQLGGGANELEEKRMAQGDTDIRVARVKRKVRMSWMSDIALRDLPVLHMDATAEKRLVDKIVGRPVDLTPIGAELRRTITVFPDATYSKSSLLPRKGETVAVKVKKAKALEKLHCGIATLAAHHGDGLVLVVCPMALEDRLTEMGRWPTNVSWMHYGATKGLDWAKDAVAVVTIGDLNARLEDIDGLVAALSFDEPEPEARMVGPDGEQPPYRTVQEPYEMRDGRILVLDVCRLAGDRAATFQRLIRDHETTQSWGRGRPVYRETPFAIYHFGRSLPAGTVVDAVVSLDDLVADLGAVAVGMADQTGGVREVDFAPADATRFQATVRRIEEDPTLHPGLAVVRDGDGTEMILIRSLDDEGREVCQRQGFDLSAVPPPPARERTRADIERERIDAERRMAAWVALLEAQALVVDTFSQDPTGLLWMPDDTDWGVNRKGEPERPVPMTWPEALRAVRPDALPAIDAEEEAVGTGVAAGPMREVDMSWLDDAA